MPCWPAAAPTQNAGPTLHRPAAARKTADLMSLHHYPPQGIVEWALAAVLRLTLRLGLKPVFSPRVPIVWQRRWLELMSRLTLPARGVRSEPGLVAGVAGVWLRPATSTARAGTVLYLHGGAYCVGSPATHRALTTRLARSTGMAVFVADYALAPERPYPAAVHDAHAVALALMADAARGPLVVAGDSAGGGLALATALALRDAGQPLPAALVVLSPWADLAVRPGAPEPRGEAMLSGAWAQACSAMYLAGADIGQPWASPLRAELRGLPPVLIQAGTDELLHGQAMKLHDALQAAGVAVRCEITLRRWHVFQLHGGALRSADDAIERIADFTGRAVDARPAASDAAPETVETVIMGAGMSGLCAGIQLKRAGRHDFVILEKSEGLGGTWWDNRYPGAHVDVPAPLYSFSFAPNPRWKRRFAAAAEIQAYMQHCAQRFGIRPHLRLGRRITGARFDAEAGLWHLRVEGRPPLIARFFICSTGPLSQPRWPDIPGLADFAGRLLHSAQWDAHAPLQGRRVGIIGTGSTAAQLLAPVAAQAGHVTLFQRTANWVLPRPDRRYRVVDRVLAHLPPYSALVRRLWFHVLEWGRRGFDDGTLARRGMLKAAALHRRHQVASAALRDQLTPSYPLGCKRIIYSSDYHPTLTQPHVALVTSAIMRITPHGVLTSNGADGREHPLDVLVCATGFDVQHSLSHVPITGLNGVTLEQAWSQGPQAHLGLTVAGFPNLFLMLGPNTATGHTSTLLYIEPGVQFVLRAMAEVQQRGSRWLAVKPAVMQRYNDALQARLGPSVWGQCRSWYRADSGRVIALFPGFTREYVRAVQGQAFGDFEFG